MRQSRDSRGPLTLGPEKGRKTALTMEDSEPKTPPKFEELRQIFWNLSLDFHEEKKKCAAEAMPFETLSAF